MLKEQQNLLSNVEYLNSNPFEITESDIEEANTNNNLKDTAILKMISRTLSKENFL